MTASRTNPEPVISSRGVPWCTSTCGRFVNKQCELLGHRPESICEPYVAEMVQVARGAMHILKPGGKP